LTARERKGRRELGRWAAREKEKRGRNVGINCLLVVIPLFIDLLNDQK
jgi:hypothetical protein